MSLSVKDIKELRDFFVENVREYKGTDPISIDIPIDILEAILFKEQNDFLYFAIPSDVQEKINFRGVSFNNFNCFGFNFSHLHGVTIDPQKVFHKNLSQGKYKGVGFIGSFKDAYLGGANFTGSRDAVIDPQEIRNKDLTECVLSGVKFIGSFNGVKISGADFTKSYGAEINPQKIYEKDLSGTKLASTKIIGVYKTVDFEGVNIIGTDFRDAAGYKAIDPQTVHKKNMSAAKLQGVIIKGRVDGCVIRGTDFTGSIGAKINDPESCIYDEETIFTDAQVINSDQRTTETIKEKILCAIHNK